MLDIWYLPIWEDKYLQYTYLITNLLKNLNLIVTDDKTRQSKLTNNLLEQPNKLLVNLTNQEAKLCSRAAEQYTLLFS
jgi:hypothetical protein